MDPNIVLTTSKADDGFIEVLRTHSEPILLEFAAYIHPLNFLVDANGGIFQIRPHKEFLPSRGRDRVLSLRFLADLPEGDHAPGVSFSDSSSASEARNAYDFMNKRKAADGDPTQQRWNASIRLANFASVDTAPLCVSPFLIHCSTKRH